MRLLFFLLISVNYLFGQIDSTQPQIPEVSYLKGSGGIMLAGHFIGKTITGEIGYIKSNVTKVKDYRADIRDSASKGPFYLTQPYSAVSAGSEFFLNGTNFGIGPKIGFTYNWLIFQGKINTTYYTDFTNKKDLRISPSVGFSLAFVNIMYNFNFPILKDHFSNIAINRISLIFLLAKKQ